VCEPCRYCASERVVPVLDKRIEQSDNAGNKYRTRCLNCGRWLPMTSADEFEDHDDPHVLPADQDPEGDDPTIPIHEYDYADETAELAAKIDNQGVETQPAVTDGGQEIEDDDQEDDGDDDLRPVEEHTFECPATGCESTLTGFPESCSECGAGPFNWPENAAERWRNGDLS